MPAEYVLALGSNVPAASERLADTLFSGIEALASEGLVAKRKSNLYRTPAFPAGSGPDFVNAAILVRSELPPSEVLERMHRVEARFGRDRRVRWAPRTLDLDLISAGNAVLPDQDTFSHWEGLPLSEQRRLAPDRLVLPHPRLQDRAFVLVPMADIAPSWRHPVLGQTVLEMLDALPHGLREEVDLLGA
ncbi:MAG: 2-amino-4-hydroxy-6-hydroxymethyldihydropteridine diphosphokinase [Pseudomonadota bacterium]